jgi:hypothetical protein
MLDLKKNDPAVLAEVGYTFNVILPDGTKTDAKITVRGSNSPTVTNHGRKIYHEFQVKKEQAKRRGREPEDLTLEEAEKMAAESAAVRVITWTGLAEGGEEVVYSKDTAVRVMLDYPFIREQVMKESDNIHNFSKRED